MCDDHRWGLEEEAVSAKVFVRSAGEAVVDFGAVAGVAARQGGCCASARSVEEGVVWSFDLPVLIPVHHV